MAAYCQCAEFLKHEHRTSTGLRSEESLPCHGLRMGWGLVATYRMKDHTWTSWRINSRTTQLYRATSQSFSMKAVPSNHEGAVLAGFNPYFSTLKSEPVETRFTLTPSILAGPTCAIRAVSVVQALDGEICRPRTVRCSTTPSGAPCFYKNNHIRH